jgi:hypothetical protein
LPGAGAMAEREAIFQLTAHGATARDVTGLRLPETYRVVLECMCGPTPFHVIAASLEHLPEYQIASCLGDLEAIGLVESVPLEWLCELHLVQLSGKSRESSPPTSSA